MIAVSFKEMGAVEVKEVDGGLCVAIVINVAVMMALYGAFMAGYDDAQNQ